MVCVRIRKAISFYTSYYSYKSRRHFPGPIESHKYKVTFQLDKHALEVAVKAYDSKETQVTSKLAFNTQKTYSYLIWYLILGKYSEVIVYIFDCW